MSFETKDFSNLAELMKALPDEQAAVDYFTAIRWKNGAFCPYCGSTRVYHFSNKRSHKCGDCRQRFSIKVGTIFEDSKLGLRLWMLAVWYISSHKKGIASTQLGKDLGVTQKTAWFMMHRLRHAARTRSFNRPLRGTVEADEAFVGGKDKNQHADKRGLKKKAIVIGMLERGGELRVSKVKHLREAADLVARHIHPGANLMTDEYTGYKRLSDDYRHEFVTHSHGQYVRYPKAPESYNAEWEPIIHVNSIEGYWSQLKRQIFGIHHWVSAKHLGRYVDESVWRFNRRAVGEAARFNEMLKVTSGRLT
jgi:transposase-like protein